LTTDTQARRFSQDAHVRNDSKEPGEIPTNLHQQKGEYLHIVNDSLLGVRFRDKRDVFFLSTFHRKLVTTRKTDNTGNVVTKDTDEYNQGMGISDKNYAIITQHTMVQNQTSGQSRSPST